MIPAALAQYKLAAEILVFGALAVGAAYSGHLVLEHAPETGRAEIRAECDRQAAKDKEAAFAISEAGRSARDTAVTEGAKREETIRSLAATSAAATGGLRDVIANVDRAVPNYSSDAYVRSPVPTGSFLRSAQEDAERWQKKLSDSTAKSEP